ncbi:unnamed protein product [Penicillium olsonii]|nr:unnamed protein product [Penicillium olsonii]
MTSPGAHSEADPTTGEAKLIEGTGQEGVVSSSEALTLLDATKIGDHATVKLLLEQQEVYVDPLDEDLSSPLIIASRQGFAEIAFTLLLHGANANISNKAEESPLLEASWKGHSQIAAKLLDYGAALEDRDKRGDTSLLLAAFNGHDKIVSELLNRGANVEAYNCQGNTSLLLAAYNGYDKIVSELLSHGAKIEACNESGNTSLQLAASSGKDQVIVTLLSRGAVVDTFSKRGDTALMLACWESHESSVRILLSYKASVAACFLTGCSPLHLAAKKDDMNIIRLLLSRQKADECIDGVGRTPLHAACMATRYSNAEILLDNGADVNRRDFQGFSPLHLTAWEVPESEKTQEEGDLIELLLSRGARINDDTCGWSPLRLACESKNLTAIECLVSRGANVHQSDTSGDSPFQIALQGELDIQEFHSLLFEEPGVLRTDEQGWSVLHQASQSWSLPAVEAILSEAISIRGFKGPSPLVLALRRESRDVALCLLRSEIYYSRSCVGIFVNLTPENELSEIEQHLNKFALSGMLSNDDLTSIIHWMIVNKMDTHLRDDHLTPEPSKQYKNGMTAAHIAARHGNSNLLRSLSSTFNPGLIDDDRNTVLHAAAVSGNLETNKFLLGAHDPGRRSAKHTPSRTVDLIMQLNGAGESPFSLAVRGHHTAVWDYFRDELVKCTLQLDGLNGDPLQVSTALELAFRFEKPGRSERLIQLMKTHFRRPVLMTPNNSPALASKDEEWGILHYVVFYGQAIALWWLLANGWGFGTKETEIAQRILEADRRIPNSAIMLELLQNPPQRVEQTGVSDSHHLPDLPSKPPNLSLGDFQTTILDLYVKNENVELHLVSGSPENIIYNHSLGPHKLMKDSLAMSHRQMASLRRDIEKPRDGAVGVGVKCLSRSPCQGPVEVDTKLDLGIFHLRWIHLPFNHVSVRPWQSGYQMC